MLMLSPPLVADREQWTLKFVPCNWQDCLNALRAGQLDLMPDVARTPEREDLYRRMAPAHRATYETHVGPVPEGLELDHLCFNPWCVNPAHLEPVTSRVNTLRGVGPSARNAQRTHCVHGHPFDVTNTYLTPYGARRCRACIAARQRARRTTQQGATA